MNETTISIEDEGGVRTIVLDRPQRRNAMTAAMQNDLIAAMHGAASGGCRVVVLRGAGDAFCSGLDLGAMKDSDGSGAAVAREDAERIAGLFRMLYELPVPSIAAVHGPALAGGAGLAMLCDFTLAASAASFGFPEVRIGFIPALVSVFLALQIGDKRARDLLLTGRRFDAAEAQRLGIVNEVVAEGKLTDRVSALARSLAENSPESLTATKRLMAAQHKLWIDSAIEQAIEASVRIRGSAGFREGLQAYLEKRKPAWR